MSNVLDLSDAGDVGFEPVPAKTYECAVHDLTPTAVSNEGGSLAKGNPGWKAQLRIDDGGEFDGHFFWDNMWIPPKNYDKEKRKFMLGRIVNFLTSIGYAEDDVRVKSFDIANEVNEIKGRKCRVTVGIDREQGSNPVKGYKPLQVPETAGLL